MSESLFPPFLHWGNYKSNDEKHPDILNIEVLETETFETEYGINARAKVDGTEYAIPLHSFASKNKQLLQKWTDAIKNGKIQAGTKFMIRTWLGISKNKNPIRRFELVF
jgi:hypothetical protein